MAQEEDADSRFKSRVCKRFPLFLCWQTMLCGVQAGDGLGQSRVVSLPSEFPSCGSILQGDAPPEDACELGDVVPHSPQADLWC